MKKTIVLILISSIACFVILYDLVTRNQRKSGGFERNNREIGLKMSSVIPLPDRLFGFAGSYNGSIMLRSYAEPQKLFQLDQMSAKLDTLNLGFPSGFHKNVKEIFKDCLDSTMCITNRFGDLILVKRKVQSHYTMKGLMPDNFQLVAPGSIIARTTISTGKGNNRALVKILISDSARMAARFNLPDLSDAFFANDGWLYFDPVNRFLYYMYFYKGEILKLDTGLNLLQRIKTIDTVTRAEIKIDTLHTKLKGKSVQSLTQARPPKIVNRFLCADEGHLYVLSRANAGHEKRALLSANEVIDVYELANGKYSYSFYIPRYLGNRITHFKITGAKLWAIFGSSLIRYDFEK